MDQILQLTELPGGELTQLMDMGAPNLRGFHDRLKESDVRSIDDFLESNPIFAEIGKRSIAAALTLWNGPALAGGQAALSANPCVSRSRHYAGISPSCWSCSRAASSSPYRQKISFIGPATSSSATTHQSRGTREAGSPMKDLRVSAKAGVEGLKRTWRRHQTRRVIDRNRREPGPPPVAPIWPLPRQPGGPPDEEIRARFAAYPFWHYAYQFTGGLDFAIRHTDQRALADSPARSLQRFRHFMPSLLDACSGSLAGKRVLDIGCNAGFWSIQCALLGAREVVGFDARPELIEQAKLVASIVGVENTQFRVLNIWDMHLETFGGSFDVVLNLGVLYHLPKALEALELTKALTREHVVLDTVVLPTAAPLIRVRWEEPTDIRSAAEAGVVMTPSRRSVELMLRHLHFTHWTEIPLRTADIPEDYLSGNRASWLIRA